MNKWINRLFYRGLCRHGFGKARRAVHICNLSAGGRGGRGIVGICWPASSAELLAPGFVRNPFWNSGNRLRLYFSGRVILPRVFEYLDSSSIPTSICSHTQKGKMAKIKVERERELPSTWSLYVHRQAHCTHTYPPTVSHTWARSSLHICACTRTYST